MMHIKHALIAILLGTAIIGVAFEGLAFGSSLRLGNLFAMAQHPLFTTGMECLSASAVLAILIVGMGRQR